MSGPDFHHGYLRVPLAVWRDLYCRTPLTRRQVQLVSVILRESWGWSRRGGEVAEWTRPLTTAQFSLRTGLRPDRIRRDLRALAVRGLVEERDGRYRLLPERGLTNGLGTTLGITPPGARELPPKGRGDPSKRRNLPARTAPSTPGLKIEKIKKTYGGSEDGPGGLRRRGNLARIKPEARLQAILQFFAGPFTPEETALLHRWVARNGMAAVWRALEPALREDESGESLRELLRRQASAEPEV